MRRLTAVLALLVPLAPVSLTLLPTPPLAAQAAGAAPAPAGSPVSYLSSIEIPVEVSGKDGLPARDLKPSDLTALLDGKPAAVGAVGPWKRDWRIVVYVDRAISSSRTVRGAAGSLASLARDLAALGPVEVVVAEPQPRVFFAASREPKRIDDALSRLWLQSEGRDDLRELRRRWAEEREVSAAEESEDQGAAGSSDPDGEEAGGGAGGERDAGSFQASEIRLVRDRLDTLTEWLLAHRGEGPGLLFLVSDGFDVDPSAFYGGPKTGGLDELAARTSQSLAALGWTVFPLPMGDVVLPDLARVRPGGSRQAPIGGTVTLGSRRKDGTPRAAPPVLRNPLEPLGWLAEASGGQLLLDPQGLATALAGLKGRFNVSLPAPEVAAGTPAPLALAVQRSGMTLRSTRWQGLGLPASITARRALRLLEGEEEGGGIEVLAGAQSEPGEGGVRKVALELKVQTRRDGAEAPEGPAPGGPLVATLATPSGENLLFRQPLRDGEARAGGELAYLLRFDAPAGVDRLLAVVEAAGGSPWGGTGVPLEEVSSAGSSVPGPAVSGPEALATGAFLRIKPPPGAELAGRVRIEVDGEGEGIARIDLLVAGRKVGECPGFPCAPEVELARRPVLQWVRAIAFDAAGKELARDELPLNDPDGFQVRIVEPSGRRGVGLVEVEAEVRGPAGAKVERVEFFWDDLLAGTVHAPPYRHRVRVPASQPLGTLRVEARLADGTTSEDSVVLNAPGLSERIDVRLVEVHVVVSDEHGKPVRGLPREAFRLSEGGREQEVASFENTGELPLTLALAIDSSASMFRKLPVVGAAVESLLAEGLTPRDRALLVRFDDAPHLVQAATRDLSLLTSALRSLRADGGTGLWDAVSYSLSQLRGIRGRKALIVYSDGIDEGGKVTYAQCLRAVRESGLPVFLIVSNALAAAGQDGGFVSESIGSRLRRLTEGVGGKVVFLGPGQNLPQVYQEILADLRSRYTLAYYPAEDTGRADRRPGAIDVKLVGRRGLEVKVVSGGSARR